jgi:molecular chaperone GrpE
VQDNSNQDNNNQTEVAGPGGADLKGGDVTPPQDAEAAAEENVQTRIGEQDIHERQHNGEVAQQTEELHPKAEDSAGDEAILNSDEDAKKNSETARDVESELSEAKTQLLHLAADFENFKRQALRREQEVRERSVRSVLEDLLPVLDNFERAVEASAATSDVQSLKIGVEYILKQFQEAIAGSGATPIDAVGKPFDPAHHDAIEEIESEQASGTVVQDVQRGYLYKDKVLRPSRVRVAK